MNALSAADAISPAIDRTKRYLFRPFEWGPYLKVCTVAILTEGFSASSNFSSPGNSTSHATAPSYTPFALTPTIIAEIVASLLLALVVAFFVFYLITRLRFASFIA
jgi:VIT1/CCC1 family predicted Fe2+/Mn2+ transporter